MAVAGRVAIVPKGEWSVKTAYKRLDAVTVNNTLYIAKKDVPAGTATINTEYWSKSISGGAVNVATDTEDGLMPKEDKKKLDGIDGDVAAKLGESKDGSLTYNGTEIKPRVETGKGLSIGEDGKLQVNIDGTTLTMDEVNNVIKLADTLKNAINGAFPAANVANNQVTTEAGFALDARQANPNIDGTLAKQISDLNGSTSALGSNFKSDDIYAIIDSPFSNGYASRIYTQHDENFGSILSIQKIDKTLMPTEDSPIFSSFIGLMPKFLYNTDDLNGVVGNRFLQVSGSLNSPVSGMNFFGLNLCYATVTTFQVQILFCPNEDVISGSFIPRGYIRAQYNGVWREWRVLNTVSF